MKVKQTKEVELTAGEAFTLFLNENAEAGDTVARELVFMCDGSVFIDDDNDTPIKVIDAYTLEVGDYASPKWAIIPCEGLGRVAFHPSSDCILWYKILV